MFEVLKNWITSIAVVIIFIALIDMILPSNSLKKYARLVLGLIIIIIIITPVFNLLSGNGSIEAKINEYMSTYDKTSNSKEKPKNSYISSETIKVFKENLRDKIEQTIYEESGKKYNVIQIYIVEDQNAANFLEVKGIELKDNTKATDIKKVSKIDLTKTENEQNYYLDKEVVGILKDKFNINTSVIKFVR